MNAKALIVEDEMVVAWDLTYALTSVGYSVPGIATTADEAVRMIEQHAPDIVLIDIVLKGERDGIELAHDVREKYHLPFVFITAHTDRATVARAKEVQPLGYLVKPFNKEEVYATTEIALSTFNDADPDDRVEEAEDASPRERGTDRLEHVKSFIDEHLAENLTLDRLADAAGLSKYHFSRLFKAAMGVPPYQYVVQQRVERAKHLLRQTDLSVTQIALRTGFYSQSHFSGKFRQHAGATPSAYRKQAGGCGGEGDAEA